jgi:hypothetical protein
MPTTLASNWRPATRGRSAPDSRRATLHRQQQHAQAQGPAITADGVRIEVVANVASSPKPNWRLPMAPMASACCAPSFSSSTGTPRRTKEQRLPIKPCWMPWATSR